MLVNTVFVAPATLRERMDALVAGYEMGRRASPLFGASWPELWDLPLDRVRASFGLDARGIVGEGIRAAA